ncbi:MAG: hypothetical protein HND55_01890 [Pseudomonadota bacterium]|nr:MAG: hypothetical protein HND55_01890 [Pseudomonadota bacterium]
MPVKNLFCVRAAALIAALTVCGALYADQPFSSLEERMTAREFREAGLDKLSPEELAALNRWIRERSLAEGEAVELRRQQAGPAGDRRGFDDGDRSTIRSRIKGPFTGWTGETEFHLENGMVWRQAQGGVHDVPEMQNPAVEIRPGMFGSWQLIVEGYNRRVRVERIK